MFQHNAATKKRLKKVEKELEKMVEKGLLYRAGINEKGETIYKYAEKGLSLSEKVLADNKLKSMQ